MRRLTALLLVLALTLALVPCAQAGMPLPYGEDAVISVLTLTDAQRALVDYLYQPILDCQTKIDLPDDTLYEDVNAAMACLMQDYPELFHLDTHYTISYYVNRPEIATALMPRYRMSLEESIALRSAVCDEAVKLLNRDMTPIGLHDMLLERTTYVTGTVWCGTVVGALLEGQANCEGYAQALSLLYRMAGVPCGVVTGESINAAGVRDRHSWNIANLGGYTLIDPTWNDQDGMGLNTHWYYGLSTSQMAADHTPDADNAVPWCGTQANWHQARGSLVASREDFYREMRSFVRDGGMLNIRVTDESLYRSLTADLNGFLEAYNAWCEPDEGFWGSYSYSWSDEQQCLLIYRIQ